jgi:hypothetical protein
MQVSAGSVDVEINDCLESMTYSHIFNLPLTVQRFTFPMRALVPAASADNGVQTVGRQTQANPDLKPTCVFPGSTSQGAEDGDVPPEGIILQELPELHCIPYLRHCWNTTRLTCNSMSTTTRHVTKEGRGCVHAAAHMCLASRKEQNLQGSQAGHPE